MPRTSFVPSQHGFHFENNFNGYIVVLPILPLTFPFGGLCGGMSLAALRYYLHRLSVPSHTTIDFEGTVVWPLASTGSRLRQYLVECQRDSYGPLRDFSLVNWFTPPHVTFETQFEWTLNEFVRVKNHIDATGEPVVIGLRRRTDTPFGHQVLAIGYDESPKRVYIYDPNFADTELTLRIDEVRRRLVGPHRRNLEDPEWWSSFFVTDAVTRPDRPTYLDLGLQEGVTVRSASTPPRVGERLEIEVAVRNFGDFPAVLQQLYMYVRDPMGHNRDDLLGGGDSNADPIPPGGERRIRRVSERFGDIPGTYTIGVSYLSQQGHWISIPAVAGGTRQDVAVDLLPATPLQPIGTWTSLGGVLASPPTVGTNQDGRLEVFARGLDHAIWHLSQHAPEIPSTYSDWEQLPGEQRFRGPVSVVKNNWHKLEIFARGRDNAVWHRWQNEPNVREGARWSPWSSLGSAAGGMSADPTAGLNWDNRIEVFTVGLDNQVYHNWQRWFDAFGAPWSGWHSLPGQRLKGRVTVENDADGRMHVVGRSLNDNIWINHQLTRGGDWSGWIPFGGPASGDLILAKNSDRRLELFARGADSRIWHRWQETPNGNWSNWQPLNAASIPQAYLIGEGRGTIIRNHVGELELFVRAGSSELMSTRQISSDPYWSNWTAIGANCTSDPAVGSNPGGIIGVFALGLHQERMHSWFRR